MGKRDRFEQSSPKNWGRLKPVALDPLEAVGLPSKGDTRLLHFQAQEDYFHEFLDRCKSFPISNHSQTDSIGDALASLNIKNDSEQLETRTLPYNGMILRLRHITNPKDLAVVTQAMRKLREACIATSRTDSFAFDVYIFIVHATILIGHIESYHPALLHLIRKLFPAAPQSKYDLEQYVGFYILDLACRQNDLGAAFEIRQVYNHRDQTVDNILKALVCNNWSLYWNSRQSMNLYQLQLMKPSNAKMSSHALNCIGAAYLKVDRQYLEQASQKPWSGEIETERPGWQVDDNIITIKAIKRK